MNRTEERKQERLPDADIFPASHMAMQERMTISDEPPEVPPAKRKIFLYGLLGAFLGALPGMTVWIVLGIFGIRAMILGFFLAAGTVWGYGRMIRKYSLWKGWGILICTFIMLITVYLAQKITWTWGISEAFERTADYAEHQVMTVAREHGKEVSESAVRDTVEAMNKDKFGFTKGNFVNCYTHFYTLLDFFSLKKDFISALIQSYISAALGASSLLKNLVRKQVHSQLGSAEGENTDTNNP
jgi:hypothetical protein